MTVFISYSNEDKKKVNKIIKYIHSDIYTWIDHQDIIPSSILNNTLKKGIDKADFFIIFISNNTIRSKWVQKELDWSIEREKKLKYNFILPIMLDIESYEKCKKDEIKKKSYIKGYELNNKVLAEEVSNTLVSMNLEKSKYPSEQLQKSIYEFVPIILFILAFFLTPSKIDHITDIKKSYNFDINQFKYKDMWLFSYSFFKVDSDQTIFSLGLYKVVLNRTIYPHETYGLDKNWTKNIDKSSQKTQKVIRNFIDGNKTIERNEENNAS